MQVSRYIVLVALGVILLPACLVVSMDAHPVDAGTTQRAPRERHSLGPYVLKQLRGSIVVEVMLGEDAYPVRYDLTGYDKAGVVLKETTWELWKASLEPVFWLATETEPELITVYAVEGIDQPVLQRTVYAKDAFPWGDHVCASSSER